MVHAVHLERVVATTDGIVLELLRTGQNNARHELDHWTFHIRLSDEDAAPHQRDSFSFVELAQKFVLTHAQAEATADLEAFCLALSRALLTDMPLASVEVTLESHLWKRLIVDGHAHETAFMRGSGERQIVHVKHSRSHTSLRRGFRNMTLLKAAPSKENADAPASHPACFPFALCLSADWEGQDCSIEDRLPPNKERSFVREHLISAFAHTSSSDMTLLLPRMAESCMKGVTSLNRLELHAFTGPNCFGSGSPKLPLHPETEDLSRTFRTVCLRSDADCVASHGGG